MIRLPLTNPTFTEWSDTHSGQRQCVETHLFAQWNADWKHVCL